MMPVVTKKSKAREGAEISRSEELIPSKHFRGLGEWMNVFAS